MAVVASKYKGTHDDEGNVDNDSEYHSVKQGRVSRSTGEELPLNIGRIFESDYQENLESLYQVSNVRCYCLGDKPVTMHIRKQQASRLLFLDDNPTSPNHSENGAFYRARKSTKSMPDIVSKIKLFELTTEFNDKNYVWHHHQKIGG